MKKKKRFAAVLTAVAALYVSGCGFGLKTESGRHSDPESSSEEKMVNTHITYVEGNSERQTETGLESATESPAAVEIEIPDTAEYIVSFLSDEEREVFAQIYDGLSSFDESIEISPDVIHKDDVGDFIAMLTYAVPYIDYIGQEYTICIDSSGYVASLEITYNKSRKQSESERAELDKRIDEIVSQISPDWSDYEKVLYFHDEIALNCRYDDSADNPYSAYGCLVEGRAVCEGYSKAMQILCTKAGVKCIPVAGKAYDSGEPQPHLWNKLMLDGEWSNFDVTWDDPVTDIGDNYVRYDYFGIADSECGSDHVADENKYFSYPEAFSASANYYKRNGLYADDSEPVWDIMSGSVERAMTDGSGIARLKCSDSEVYSAAVDELFGGDSGGEIFTILRQCSEEVGGGWSSASYSVIKNDELCTITVILSSDQL